MNKTAIGPQIPASPMPVFLVGALVDNEPNFLAIGWGSCVSHKPPMFSIALNHSRYTSKGIKQNGVFSVNIPSVELVKETDFCGIVSGSKMNKTAVCKFNIFYGERTNAPMIEQCPLNLECTVVHTLDMGSHELFIGRIEETHIDEDCLTEGKPDTDRLKPFVVTTGYINAYRSLNEIIADAFSVGNELK